MILKAEDQRIVRRHECRVANGVYDVFEEDDGAHGFAVGYDGLLILTFTVPAIQLHAP